MLTLRQRLSQRDDPTNQTFSLDFFRGLPFCIQAAVFADNGVVSIADTSAITLYIKDEVNAETSLLACTVPAVDFTACTQEQWMAKTAQQLTFSFTAAETNIDLESGMLKKKLWAVVKALLNNGSTVVMARGWMTCHESGAAVTGEPPENAAPALGAAEADARYLRYDGAQTLTLEQRMQALENLGFVFDGDAVTWPNSRDQFFNAES